MTIKTEVSENRPYNEITFFVGDKGKEMLLDYKTGGRTFRIIRIEPEYKYYADDGRIELDENGKVIKGKILYRESTQKENDLPKSISFYQFAKRISHGDMKLFR